MTTSLAAREQAHVRPFGAIASAVLLPIPATALITTGQTVFGAAITLILSAILGYLRGQKAVRNGTTARFSFGIEAILFLLICIISCVVIGNIASPGDSKLFRLRFSGFSGESDIAPSYLIVLWCFSLCTIPIIRMSSDDSPQKRHDFQNRTAVALALLGAIGLALSLTVSRYEVFSSRGEGGGNGLNSLLYWCSAVFVAYVIVMTSTNSSKWIVPAAIVMTLGLILSGNRSPLALIGIAILVRIIQNRNTRVLKIYALLIPLGLVTFSYQSIWRSLVSRSLPSSPIDVFNVMMADPLQEFLRLGLDTVDGHTLVATLIDNGYHAAWLDPLLAIANFVPRQLWEGKPTLLGSSIGHDYLGLTAGGIFLSGPGYFSLVAGSLILGSALFVGFVLIVKYIVSAPRVHPVIVCAGYYLIARIAIAGDAFDIFLAIQIVVVLGIATLIGKALPWRKS